MISLTPDNPQTTREHAYAMFRSHHQTSIDAASALRRTSPGLVSEKEVCEMKRQIDQRYHKRVKLYDAGEKQWDTSTSLTMILRGLK